MNTWMVDTGPLVAYLDARDPAHDEVCFRWDDFAGRLVTTSAEALELDDVFTLDRRGFSPTARRTVEP